MRSRNFGKDYGVLMDDGPLAGITARAVVVVDAAGNVPSLDTAVCATSTRKFNESFTGRDDAVCLVISADLPFASGRFCSTEGLENVHALSMMRSRNFGKDYGVLMDDGPLAGITARAVVVVDAAGKVLYTELVPEITQEPNYDAALAALG